MQLAARTIIFSFPKNVPQVCVPRGNKVWKMAGMAHQIDVFFDISQRGSTIGTELRAGATSFLTLRFGLTIHAGQAVLYSVLVKGVVISMRAY